ncbi:MAG: DUF917 domain-containing protein [Candidatus Saliniplasma sp.]
MSRILDKESMRDMVKGAAFLGTGGGGPVEAGMDIVEELEKVTMVSLEEVDDEATIVVAESMGSPEVMSEKGFTDQTVKAFEAFQTHTGKKVDYVIPVETGAGNSITPMTVSSKKGIPVIDADGAGRAIPELQQTTFNIYGIPMCPAALADDKGDWVIVDVRDEYMMEDLSRAITTEFGGQAGLVWHMMSGREMKEVVIPEALSIAEDVGRTLRESVEKGKDPVSEVVKLVDGYEFIRGTVSAKSVETKKSFDYGEVIVKGSGGHEGSDLRVLYKNENMLAWKKEELVAMVPDRICWLTVDGEPLTNADIKKGMEVACIGIEAHEMWTTDKALNTFERVLKELDYNGEYVPLADLIKKER